ncbi:2-aminoglycoside phosphotransferase [Bacillus manliponensis]|uniref:2-aminoglycoside phosphotransferase n=1 Tax=Bacillus manliponensis TaxID=574376 RepID=A0A073JZJ4_9BACI|nr:GNAT family N-acetyltransferase [Bacillus manliponensis]KEK19627.1 2-aminoglycoside phosphotransferase [Bacillus manliponensis]
MLFQSGKISVQHVTLQDAERLSNWLTNPEVLAFYEGRDKPQSLEQVRAHYIHDDKSHEHRCIVEYEGNAIGYIQLYPVDEEWKALYGYEKEEHVWGMDQFIGDVTYWNKGIGTKLVEATITYVIEEIGAEAIAMDPRVSNERAIRCYEKCGFQKIKILKEHELHEGTLEDCWMMEYRKR